MLPSPPRLPHPTPLQVREVYEGAIEAQPPYALTDGDTRTLCMRYAALERRLGEVDRARAILVHASSLADPRTSPAFWAEWNEFEVRHGNEETFREMLRIKRSVAAAGSQQHFNTAIIDAAAVASGPSAAAGVKRKADDLVALEEEMRGGAGAPIVAPGEALASPVGEGLSEGDALPQAVAEGEGEAEGEGLEEAGRADAHGSEADLHVGEDFAFDEDDVAGEGREQADDDQHQRDGDEPEIDHLRSDLAASWRKGSG